MSGSAPQVALAGWPSPLTESACAFEVAGEQTIGIAARGSGAGPLGALIIVGGPQYRIGSHRQFVLLARALAAAGVSCFRFDLRGMGDAGGDRADFTELATEIDAARRAFASLVPGLDGVVLVGLCDGASAALLRVASDDGAAGLPVRGIVAINPWIRTQRSRAAAEVRHHYRGRFASAEFWKRLASGRVDLAAAVGGFLHAVLRTWQRPAGDEVAQYPESMARGARALADRVLWILSGRDLVAREFEQYVADSPAWRGLVDPAHGNVLRLDEADHTFSCTNWRAQVSEAIAAWVKRL